MDDDWDDGSSIVPTSTNVGVCNEGGRKVHSGRGFAVVKAKTDDEWGSYNEDNQEFSDSGLNETATRVTCINTRGARGAGGGRGTRGRRGGSHTFSGNFQDSNDLGYYDDAYGENADINNGDSWSGAGERSRGARGGRGRDRGNGHVFEKKSAEANNNKPKEIYVPIDRVTDEELFANTISSGINFMKLEDIDVNATGDNVPSPITSFESSGLREIMQENVKKSGYRKPTPIQKYAIPIVMKGRDLMGCAQTGSGKTVSLILVLIILKLKQIWIQIYLWG